MPDFERFAIPGLSADQSYEFTQRSCEVCGKPTAGHGKKWTRPYLCWQHRQQQQGYPYRATTGSVREVNIELDREKNAQRVKEDRAKGIMMWVDGKPWP